MLITPPRLRRHSLVGCFHFLAFTVTPFSIFRCRDTPRRLPLPRSSPRMARRATAAGTPADATPPPPLLPLSLHTPLRVAGVTRDARQMRAR
jgi:hypothetical protein